MSDCSTEAMKPKEPPKTCGNCGHSLIGDCVADEYRNAHLNASTDCGDWFSLEQRYQQLEHVVRDMLHEFENANNLAFNGHTDVALDVIRAAAERYRGRINDCGVTLDD